MLTLCRFIGKEVSAYRLKCVSMQFRFIFPTEINISTFILSYPKMKSTLITLFFSFSVNTDTCYCTVFVNCHKKYLFVLWFIFRLSPSVSPPQGNGTSLPAKKRGDESHPETSFPQLSSPLDISSVHPNRSLNLSTRPRRSRFVRTRRIT